MQNAIDDSVIDTVFATAAMFIRFKALNDGTDAELAKKRADAAKPGDKKEARVELDMGDLKGKQPKEILTTVVTNILANFTSERAIVVLKEALDLPIVRDLIHAAMYIARTFSPEAQEALQKMYSTILPCAMSEYQLLRNREFGIVRDSARPGELMTVTMCR
jgi:hypothetical protein